MLRKRLALLGGLATLLIALVTGVVVVAARSSYTPPPSPATVHHYTTFSYSQQEHATRGPFISMPAAESKALAVGAGPGKIASAQFLTVSQASAFLGSPATSDNFGSDRQVWLILVHGNYKPSFWNPASQPPTYNHYFVVIDASTGAILSTGSPIKHSW